LGNTKSTNIVIKSNLFQPAPQIYKPKMENIEDIQIQQVQPSTLNNIRRFITEWNQDPVSQTSGLIIVGTHVSISNGVNVIPFSLPVEELLVTYVDIPLFEDIEILALLQKTQTR
ncbi:20057_t:CDS:1, partial [Gigaspora margarita]